MFIIVVVYGISIWKCSKCNESAGEVNIVWKRGKWKINVLHLIQGLPSTVIFLFFWSIYVLSKDKITSLLMWICSCYMSLLFTREYIVMHVYLLNLTWISRVMFSRRTFDRFSIIVYVAVTAPWYSTVLHWYFAYTSNF